MSIQRADSHSLYPVTTTTNTTTITTTTTTVNSEKTTSVPPSLMPRSVGWHAKASGFDWSKPSDQRRYRLSAGLPELHAAVVNGDWETAGEMLCPDDIGLLWLPPVSQRFSANGGKQTESGAWASKLASKHQQTQLEAIRQMALDMGSKTSIEGTGCLYGANLLTLCLQTSAPPEFMEKMLDMIMTHAPQYLNLPDASGRTPLYIAVDRDDETQVRMLLKAGARPRGACRLPAAGMKLSDLKANDRAPSGKTSTPDVKKSDNQFRYPLDEPDNALSHSASSDDDSESSDKDDYDDYDDVPIPITSAYDCALDLQNCKVFPLLVEHVIQSSSWPQGYPISEDPLKLEKWASLHTEDELRALADRFPGLKSFLFNLSDSSGSSIVDRTLACNKPLDEEVIPLYAKDPELGSIYVAAISGNTDAFLARLAACSQTLRKQTTGVIREDLIRIFLANCHPSNVSAFFKGYPQPTLVIQQLLSGHKQLLSLPFENFCAVLVEIWPSLENSDKEWIACMSGDGSPRHTQFIIDLSGFDMARNGYASHYMYLYAAAVGNTTAFEFAASHRDDFDDLVSEMKSSASPDSAIKIKGLVINTLRARSLLWFEKFMTAGLNLQPLIDSDGATLLPLMADFCPARLSAWLKNTRFSINQQMIDDTGTPEGRDALMKLIQSEKKDTPKTDVEKSDS